MMRTRAKAVKKASSGTAKRRLPRRGLARFQRILRQHLPALQTQFSVKSLGVFGSQVRGQQRKNSDLDLLVEFDATPSLFEFIDLENHLSDLLGVKVDLVMKTALKPEIGRRILAEVVSV